MHYVLCLCLQAVHRCPGNTDGGWRARIQKTINLWQQLETEISHSFRPGFRQRRSLFPLAALVHPLCPGALVFYFIPEPVCRTSPDWTRAALVCSCWWHSHIFFHLLSSSHVRRCAADRVSLVRTGVCRSKEPEPPTPSQVFYCRGEMIQLTSRIYRLVLLAFSVRR